MVKEVGAGREACLSRVMTGMSTSERLALTSAFCLGNDNVNATPIENDDDRRRSRTSHRPSAFFTAEFIREFPINVYYSLNTYQHTAARASRGVSSSTVEHGIRSEIIYAEIITTITTNEHIHITQTSPISHRLTSISCDDRQHHKIVLIGLNVRVHFTEDTRRRSGYHPPTLLSQ